MAKLENIITELPENDFHALEKSLDSSTKFSALLRLYREGRQSDDIAAQLGVSKGAFYALRSRLLDRIQSFLSGNLLVTGDQVLIKLHEIPDMCYNKPREISVAFLLKLEQDLTQLDMHNELVLVYSALKKMHLFTEEYFHYSQLYNKHIAYNLSVEKSEEILGSFNRLLRQYDFSRNAADMETLQFLRKEIDQHLMLHKSRQIEIISHFISLQLAVFCAVPLPDGVHAEALLDRCEALIGELPSSSQVKTWILCVEFLRFEYFVRHRRLEEAGAAYEMLIPHRERIMLMSNVVLTSFFPLSEQVFLQLTGGDTKVPGSLKYDPADSHAGIHIRIAESVAACNRNDYKSASAQLHEILNNFSFRDFFHLELQVKLALIFVYLRMKEFEHASHVLKNLSRKVKKDAAGYNNVQHLIALFTAEIKTRGKLSERDAEQFILFEARNKGKTQLLRAFAPFLHRVYNQNK